MKRSVPCAPGQRGARATPSDRACQVFAGARRQAPLLQPFACRVQQQDVVIRKLRQLVCSHHAIWFRAQLPMTNSRQFLRARFLPGTVRVQCAAWRKIQSRTACALPNSSAALAGMSGYREFHARANAHPAPTSSTQHTPRSAIVCIQSSHRST